MIDTSLSFEEIRPYHKINERAEKYVDDSEFSKRIREYDLN